MIRNRRLSDKEVSQVMDWFVGAACRSAKSSMALWGADLMIALYQLLHYLLDPATNALGVYPTALGFETGEFPSCFHPCNWWVSE